VALKEILVVVQVLQPKLMLVVEVVDQVVLELHLLIVQMLMVEQVVLELQKIQQDLV
jgi:hypothetical protein